MAQGPSASDHQTLTARRFGDSASRRSHRERQQGADERTNRGKQDVTSPGASVSSVERLNQLRAMKVDLPSFPSSTLGPSLRIINGAVPLSGILFHARSLS